jgi:cytochrome c oxidase assembly factor CtaG
MDMGSALPRLTWQVFFSTWHVDAVWYLLIAAALACYGYGVVRVRRSASPSIHPARVVSFVLGLVVLILSLSTAVETYSHLLFWVHMVQHLLLIMVVPALLVVGQPLTVLVECTGGRVRSPVARALQSGPAAVVTHPLAGLVLYTAIIVGTHLTSFMDQMAIHTWLHPVEQVLYLVGGYLFLLPVLGNEPIRWRPPHLVRMVVLFIAMAPDTVVGIVLLQTPHNLFPAMTAHRPAWALDPVSDLNTGGGIMWAFGDGLMMLLIVAVMIAYLAHSASNATAGTWLEGVRRQTLARNMGLPSDRRADLEDRGDVDEDDELLEAYNRMLRRMNKQDQAQ